MNSILQNLFFWLFLAILSVFLVYLIGNREYVCKEQSSISSIISTSHHKTTVILNDGEELVLKDSNINLGASVCQKFDIYQTPIWADEAILKEGNIVGHYLIK